MICLTTFQSLVLNWSRISFPARRPLYKAIPKMLILSQLADDLPRKIIPWSDDFKVSRSRYTLSVHVGYVSSSADSTRNYNIFSIGDRGRNAASSTNPVHKSVFNFSHDMPHKEPSILVSWTLLQCKKSGIVGNSIPMSQRRFFNPFEVSV